jgi:hypothetical protein
LDLAGGRRLPEDLFAGARFAGARFRAAVDPDRGRGDEPERLRVDVLRAGMRRR